MGDNSTPDNEVVGKGFAITAHQYEDVWYYVSTGKGEIFGVKVSLEVCCEERYEDKRCDLLTDFEEALSKTVVGLYHLSKKMHTQEYKGTLRLTDRGIMEES